MKRNHKITAITVSLALLLNILVVFGVAPGVMAAGGAIALPDGDFESGAWGGYGGAVPYATTETDAANVHSGAKSMKLVSELRSTTTDVAVHGGNGAVVSAMDLANKSYAYEVWAKTENFNGTVFMKTDLYGAAGIVGNFYDKRIAPTIGGIQVIAANIRPAAPYVDNANLGNTGWTRYVAPIGANCKEGFTVADVNDFHVMFDISGTGTVWVDDVRIIEYDPAVEEEVPTSILVPDGSFENDAWNGYSGSLSPGVSTETNAANVRSGYKSMKIEAGTLNGLGPVHGGNSALIAKLDLANKTYAYEVWAKTENFNGTVFVKTDLYGAAGIVGNLYDKRIAPTIGGIQVIAANIRPAAPYVDNANVGTTGWTRYVIPVGVNCVEGYTAANVTDCHIQFGANGTGTVWIDDVSVIEYTPAIANSGMITNANMENGAWCDMWSGAVAGVTSETDLANVYSGMKSLKIAAPVTTTAVNGANEGLFRGLDLANKNYAFTAWVKTENFSGKFFAETNLFSEGYAPGGSFYAAGEDPSNRQIAFIDDANYGTQDWKKIVVPVKTANPDAITMHVYLGATGTGTIWVDDIDFVEYIPGVDAAITGEGTVDIPENVKPGDTVTVEVKPAEGKQLKGGVLYYSIAGSAEKYPLYARVGSMMYTGSEQDDGANSTKFIFAMPSADVQIYADFVDANAADAAQAAENNVKVFGTSYRETSATASAGLQFGSRVQRQLTVAGVAYEIQSYGTLLVREELLEGATPDTADWEGWLHTADAAGARWKKMPSTKIMDICDQHIDFAVRLVNFDNYPALKDAGYLAVAYATYAPVDGGEAITLYDAADAAYSFNEAVARTQAFEALY